MHGDDDELSERRFSARLQERRLFDVETRVTAIEAEIKRFPDVVETKLKERAVEERESREGQRDLWIRYGTLFCAVVGAAAALFKMVHG